MMQNPRAPLEGSWQAEGLTERCDRGAFYGGLAGNGSALRAAFMPLRGRVDEGIDPYSHASGYFVGADAHIRPAAFMPLRGRVDEGIDPYRVQPNIPPHRRGGHWPSAGVGRTRNVYRVVT